MDSKRCRVISWKTAAVLCLALVSWIGLVRCARAPLRVDLADHSQRAGQALAVRFLHLSDTHAQDEAINVALQLHNEQGQIEEVVAQVGGFPRLIAKIRALRAANSHVMVLHSGDAFQGTLYFQKYRGLADVELLNLMGLDAMAIGNHEFDLGTGGLAPFIKKAAFPVLHGNVGIAQDPALRGLPHLQPYLIREIAGEKIGVLGLTTPRAATESYPGPHVAFGDPAQTARAFIAKMRSEGVNKIVVLSHLGLSKDKELARGVDGIDVIVGGHTHAQMGKALNRVGLATKLAYPLVVRGPGGRTVCLSHAWESTKLLGVLDVDFDAAGAVKRCSGDPLMLIGERFRQMNPATRRLELVPPAKQRHFVAEAKASGILELVEEDQVALARLQRFAAPIDAFKRTELADVAENLWHIRVPTAVRGWRHFSAEPLPAGSQIAQHVARSMLWQARAVGHPVQLALLGAGGVRVDLPAGKLSEDQVHSLLPFSNALVLLKVTGIELKTVLERATARATAAGSSGSTFPYVAGFRYVFDMNQPIASQITSLQIEENGAWKNVDPAATYLMVTTAYQANGGEGWELLKQLPTSRRMDLPSLVDATAFAAYAKSMKALVRLPPLITIVPRQSN